jgi:phage-related protein
MNWTVEYVVNENGNVPFEDFLDSFDKDSRIEVLLAIDKLIERKNLNLAIPESQSKYLRDKIFELRVRHSNITTRRLFFYHFGERVVYTNGFIKKRNKIPNSEIIKAIKLRKYYLMIKGHHNGTGKDKS